MTRSPEWCPGLQGLVSSIGFNQSLRQARTIRVPCLLSQEKQGLEIFALAIESANRENLEKDQGRTGHTGMSIQFELRGAGKSNPMVRTACVWLVAAVGMAVAGCGQSSFRSGPDYPVKGKILLADGKPLRSGRVVFVSSETALSYAGPIGDDGGFELKQGDRVGAPAGNYKVRIEIDETSLPKRRGKSSNLPFPARYLDEDVSKLAATVKADPENAFEFKLSK